MSRNNETLQGRKRWQGNEGSFALVLSLLGLVAVALVIAGCGPSTPEQTPTPTERVAAVTATSTATALPTEPPTPVAVTAVETSPPLTIELKATVEAGLPPTPTPETEGAPSPGALEIGVLPLEVGPGSLPLWAAYSMGMGFYDPEQGHFVALYTYDEGWRELGRVVLTTCAQYVDAHMLAQVQLEPTRVWLELQSGAGAHGGCYDLLSFDGETLRHDVTHFNSSPGAGNLADLDGDGIEEVVLNWTENYVFCYACGVRLPMFQVLRWDGTALVEVALSLLPEAAPAELRRLNNRAVELAEAMLWKDALAAIDQAVALDAQDPTVAWNAILIREQAGAMAEEVSSGIYPLLSNAFYGDYDAAVGAMRPYAMEQIWEPESPLVAGTPAEGWEVALSDWISWTTGLALHVQPDLAAAHFLRGWGLHLRDPDAPEVLNLVGQAAKLDAADPLFSESAAYLAPPAPTAVATPVAAATATPAVATPVPAATATPAAGPRWEVRTLLVGPGQPGRLYALWTDEDLSAGPAGRARFLISDDNGQTWFPFPGGLPAEECVVNVNLDYATPDALYASTCQGLYRWSGAEWTFVSPEQTGMVAVVYGQPQIIWATQSFASGAGVMRSDDGGHTWRQAGSGLVSFNGVANIGIDPRDANRLYAIIWPKYAGSYLRRGTGAGQWEMMPTPRGGAQIDTGMTMDGATSALYVTAFSPDLTWQLWRTLDPAVPDVNSVQWEMVYDFGPDFSWASLLGSGWSPQGLAIYANLTPWLDRSAGWPGAPELYRSLDGGQTWSPWPIPEPKG